MTGTGRKIRIAITALAPTILLLLAAPAPAQGKIAVREKSDVVNRVVLVGDVADITDVSDEDRMYIESLKFTSAPTPDRDISFNADQVKGKLINAGLDLGVYAVSIPESITIHRKATIVTGKRILSEGIAYLKANLPWESLTVEPAGENTPRDIVLEYGEVRLEYEMSTTPKEYGVNNFHVNIILNDQHVRVIGLTSYVTIMGTVITAAGDISAGHVITEEDLAITKQDVTRLRPGAYNSEEKLLGKQTLRRMSKGDVFTHSAIEVVPDISAGDVVTIVIRKPGMEISAQAKALQKGYVGESIKVVTTDPKKVLNGIVVDSGTVEIVGP